MKVVLVIGVTLLLFTASCTPQGYENRAVGMSPAKVARGEHQQVLGWNKLSEKTNAQKKRIQKRL